MGLLEHGDDLAIGKAGLLHGTSSGKGTRKFHFWRLLIGGGITMVDKAMTVKRDKVGRAFGRVDADALVEIERCLAVFLGIAK
ncbi:hypothetical protein VWZ37_21950 [Xanthomonas citri pv. citri]